MWMFTARRKPTYIIVIVMSVCLSVCLSVCHKPVFYIETAE